MKFVLDTDVIVAAVRSPSGASAALIRALQAGELTALASAALMVEYEASGTRAEHLLASGLAMQDVLDFLDQLAVLVQPVDIHFMWRPQLRDPADEMVLEAAVNGGADAIVTFNVRDYGMAPANFGVRVLLPRDALTCLRQTVKGNDHG